MAGFDSTFDVAAEMPPMSAEKMQQHRKKKSGAFGIFRAALHILRKRTDEKETAALKKAATVREQRSGDWRKVVGSMRPLHVQETPASPICAMSPVSYSSAASPAASSSGTISRYASAMNLRDLCDGELDEEERDPDEVFDAITGDEEIDAKAEDFIAQFYKQIEHQNSIHPSKKGSLSIHNTHTLMHA